MRTQIAIALGALVAFAGCGGGDGGSTPAGEQSKYERQIADAASVKATDLPSAAGKTLKQLAARATTETQVGLATSVLVPGENRLAFGVISQDQRFVYGKTGVYIARAPDQPAKGPYVAPADSLVTEPAYRSRTAVSEDTPIAAIYAAQVPFERPGQYYVLSLTKTQNGLEGGTAQVKVVKDTPIPAVGERPPAVDTDTAADAGGDLASIETRVPIAPELLEANFKDVVGKKPVALLFATPQLCQSRVCGPVVDIELQLEAKYGDRMQFIHQEVYVDNDVNKGLRPQLRAFHLQTEPWLFTVKSDGRVATRLEGSFGVRAFESAVNAALE